MVQVPPLRARARNLNVTHRLVAAEDHRRARTSTSLAVVFDGANLRGAMFSGGTVSFSSVSVSSGTSDRYLTWSQVIIEDISPRFTGILVGAISRLSAYINLFVTVTLVGDKLHSLIRLEGFCSCISLALLDALLPLSLLVPAVSGR